MDRKWWTLIAVCVGTFMLLLDVTIVNVALPSIQASLKASFSDLQWVIDAYALMLAALLLTTGRSPTCSGAVCCSCSGLVDLQPQLAAVGSGARRRCGSTWRAAPGDRRGGDVLHLAGLLGRHIPGRERGTAFGVWGAITGLAVAIGPVVGGALTTGLSGGGSSW